MENRFELRNKAEEEKSFFDKFEECFPSVKIKEITKQDIPTAAMDYFEHKSRSFINVDDYRPGNFEKFFVVEYDDGRKTFLAQQTKVYKEEAGTERSTYFFDMENNKILGRAELRFNIKHPKKYERYFKNKPFVGWIETEKESRREGLGRSRLRLMGAFSQALYGLPLYSDTIISPEAKLMFESLVEKGEAKKFKEGPHDRYVLLEKAERREAENA